MCLLDRNIIVEVDGIQHFQQVSNWTSPIITQQKDKFKEECAKLNGYHVIRIYQEDVFRNEYDWQTALCEAIAYLQAVKINTEIVYICDKNKHDVYESHV